MSERSQAEVTTGLDGARSPGVDAILVGAGALRAPDTFATAAAGTEVLKAAGVTVIALPEYANTAQAPNRHLLW